MFSLDSPFAKVDTIFELIIEPFLMSNSKLDIFTFYFPLLLVQSPKPQSTALETAVKT